VDGPAARDLERDAGRPVAPADQPDEAAQAAGDDDLHDD
jgi:hypothetical protein